MSSYYSIQDQDIFRAHSNIKVAIAVVLQAFCLWLYANAADFVSTFWFVYAALILTAYITFFFGVTDYAKSKGYGWGYAFLGALNLIGLAILVFMPDRFLDQEVPKMKVRRLSW
jgi:ABC-type transport system involved in cytochrome c biogenesis permease subunit